MGASQSQDSDSEVRVEKYSVNPQNQGSNVQPMERTADPAPVDSKSSRTVAIEETKKIQLPHNCETILKDADSPVDMSSIDKLLARLHAGVFLNQRRRKYWVDKNNKNCFMLFARDLSITWSEDSRYWQWSSQKETTSDGDVFIDVAELLKVCWLEAVGKFDVAKLSRGTLYEVVFIVMLRNEASGWKVPVNFRLTLPNKQKVERKEILKTKPRGKWIEITMGEFTTSSENVGELEIYFHEYEAGVSRTGLVVKGVAIRPKD